MRQCYATADLGLIAYESQPGEGLVVDEGIVLELVKPGAGELVADGDVGEVVVTPLRNRAYPLVRFATGDLSAFLDSAGSCGRSNRRIKAGWAAPTRPPRSRACLCTGANPRHRPAPSGAGALRLWWSG